MANVVGERFQITIDKKLRRELGISPGDLAVERVEEGRLVVEFVPRAHRESLLGALRDHARGPIGDWTELKDSAWERRSREIRETLER